MAALGVKPSGRSRCPQGLWWDSDGRVCPERDRARRCRARAGSHGRCGCSSPAMPRALGGAEVTPRGGGRVPPAPGGFRLRSLRPRLRGGRGSAPGPLPGAGCGDGDGERDGDGMGMEVRTPHPAHTHPVPVPLRSLRCPRRAAPGRGGRGAGGAGGGGAGDAPSRSRGHPGTRIPKDIPAPGSLSGCQGWDPAGCSGSRAVPARTARRTLQRHP